VSRTGILYDFAAIINVVGMACVLLILYGEWMVFFFFKQKTAYEIGLGIPAEPLFRSHFVHIPGLSYSGVKSPTECQQSLFESHFASRQSLSDCPVAF